MVKNRFFKIILTCFLGLAVCVSVFFCYLFISPDLKIEENNFAKNNFSVCFKDEFMVELEKDTQNKEVIAVEEIPSHVKNAFVAIEDKRFYSHCGIDIKGMLRAVKNNLFSKSIKEGGSTITQQLIKNTHLSSEKTLKRKLKEIRLALKLERMHTKQEILGYYLNGVYFGEGVYGIENASRRYFGKSAKDLTLVEGCALASTVKAPSVYNPTKPSCESRKNLILKQMYEQGYITESEFLKAKEEKVKPIAYTKNEYLAGVYEELFDILKFSPYENKKITVITYYDKICQRALDSTLKKSNQGGVITNAQGKIKGYKLSEGDFERSPASTVKPLIVYAPAIEEGVVHLATKILDEKTNFGGYCPSNYNDKYYGWVSVKDALCKSLNVPAVKVLDALSVQKARLYARKLGFEINDEGLGIALGSYNGGITLKNLCASYTVFCSQGNYYKPTFIKEIFLNGKSVYKDQILPSKVFSSGTCEIINNALNECAISGTAKAIGKRDYSVCAKTGTVGFASGNTDAYTIAYTSNLILGLRFCNADNSLMENEITGGEVARYASAILDDIYSYCQKPKDFELSNEVTYANMCLSSYEQGILQLANNYALEKEIFSTPILTKYIKNLPIAQLTPPNATINIKVDNDKITLLLEKKQEVYCIIERKINGKFKEIALVKEPIFSESNLSDGIYEYKITPYITDISGQKIYGEEIILPPIKICAEEDFILSPWWDD